MRNAQGFSLVELLVGSALIGFVILMMSIPLTQTAKVQRGAQSLLWLEDHRSQLMFALKDDLVIANMIKDESGENPSVHCLRDNQDCQDVRYNPDAANYNRLILRSRQGDVISNSTNLASGFTYSGQPCEGFDAAAGNDNCPFRVVVHWYPQCAGSLTSCLSPELLIMAEFRYSPQVGLPMRIDPDRYTFKILRSFKSNSITETCTQQNGVMTSATTCVIGGLDSPCAVGTAIVGFTNENVKICQPLTLPSQSCPGGTFLQGFNSDGTQICSGCP